MVELSDDKLRVFISGSCGPCKEIKQLIEEGKFNQEEVEILDLESVEGFPWLEKMQLTKVPAVYKGKQACELEIDMETKSLIITCPEGS